MHNSATSSGNRCEKWCRDLDRDFQQRCFHFVLDQTARDRQREPNAAETMLAFVLFLNECVEDFAQHLRLNANAGIGNFHQERT